MNNEDDPAKPKEGSSASVTLPNHMKVTKNAPFGSLIVPEKYITGGKSA
jgi:hypothetical protein